MATLRIDAQSAGLDQARQDLLQLRQRMTDINVQLERNATEYRRASEVQRQNLKLGREELTLARRRASNSAAQIRNYIAEQNELKRLAREKERANRISRAFQSTLRGLAQDFRFFAVGIAVQGLQDFARDVVRISTETETARATLRQFTNDVEGTFQRLERESRTLVGIDLTSITQTFTQFRAGGAEAEEAITLIRGFSKSLAELGVVGHETVRFMGQLRQSFAANRIEGDDVKTLIEVMPTFLNRASQSLGVQVESWKDLQDAIDASGKTVRQFYVDLARQQDLESAGADLNTFRAQSELFREEVQRLQRRLGEIFLPTLTSIVSGLRELVSATNEETDAISRLNIEIENIPQRGIFQGEAQPGIVQTKQRLSEVVSELRTVRTEIESVEQSFDANIGEVRDRVQAELRTLRESSRDTPGGVSGFAGRGIRQEIDRQARLLSQINRLIRNRQLLAAEVLKIEQQITAETTRQVSRPTPTFEADVERPRSTLFPQQRPETPDTSTRRPLSEIGPSTREVLTVVQALGGTLSEDLQRLRRVLVPSTETSDQFGGIRPTIPSQFQAGGIDAPPGQVSPQEMINLPDLSEGISDINQMIAILQITSRDALNRLRVNARVASIPVFNFARGLRGLGGVLRQAKTDSDEYTRSLEARRRQFAEDLNREALGRQRFSRNALETGTGIAFDLTEIPIQQLQLGARAADQRGGVGRQASAAFADVQRDLARRIEEIENTRELSARERAERITEIQRAAAQRREDIEISAARRIAEIDRQLAEARRNALASFVDNAISQINRLIQAELASRLIQQLSGALPGPLGAAALIATSFGLTAARAGIGALRQSSVDNQIQRVNSASGQNSIVLETRYDDGTIRKQNDGRARVINEGRTPR